MASKAQASFPQKGPHQLRRHAKIFYNRVFLRTRSNTLWCSQVFKTDSAPWSRTRWHRGKCYAASSVFPLVCRCMKISSLLIIDPDDSS